MTLMLKLKTIFVLATLMFIISIMGLPSNWKINFMASVAVLICILSAVLDRELNRKKKPKKFKKADTFTDSGVKDFASSSSSEIKNEKIEETNAETEQI